MVLMNEKKNYEKPVLSKHGKLEDITKEGKIKGPGDGPSLMMPS
jgi:hypothetical protein